MTDIKTIKNPKQLALIERYNKFKKEFNDYINSTNHKEFIDLFVNYMQKSNKSNTNNKYNNDQIKKKFIIASKYSNIDDIKILYHHCNHKEFAENNIIDLINKAKAIKDTDISWSYIGRLQSKNIKAILPIISEIHTLSSFKQYKVIHNNLELINTAKLSSYLKLFIQINISNESKKSGIKPQDLKVLINSINNYQLEKPHELADKIKLCGLMAIPSKIENIDFNKKDNEFYQLAKLNYLHGFNELSLGMSMDWKKALNVGSSCVRIGSAIINHNHNN